MNRPDRPTSQHAGYEYQPYADDNWRLVTGKRCRMMVDQRGCGHPAQAECARPWGARRDGAPHRWWAYCGEHLYGRWIEGGKVMAWRLVPTSDSGEPASP